MKKSIFSLLLIVSIGCADFIRDDINNIVTDSFTNLQWQDAIDYCETLSLGGYSDWHLPSKNELLSITDINAYNPSISSVFQNTITSFYWSSKAIASVATRAWRVHFRYGLNLWGNKDYGYNVRCVR